MPSGPDRSSYYSRHQRNPESKRFYASAAWSGPNGARTNYIREHPICERCQKVVADHVHHKIPLAQCTPEQRIDAANMMSVCVPCHNIIEAQTPEVLPTTPIGTIEPIEDEQFYFDEEAADRPCRFIQRFAHHYEGRFAGQPFVLLDWQRQIVRTLFGWKHRQTGLRRFRELYLISGKGCIAGETRVYDPIADTHMPVNELCEEGIAPMVLTLNGPRQASVPFVKGVAPLYRVETSGGRVCIVTMQHRFLTPNGWKRLSEIGLGEHIRVSANAHAPSIRDIAPSELRQDGRHSLQTTPDFLENCSQDYRLYDGLPRTVPNIAPLYSPLQGDALSPYFDGSDEDDRGRTPEHSRPDLLSAHPSMQGSSRPSCSFDCEEHCLYGCSGLRCQDYNLTGPRCNQATDRQRIDRAASETASDTGFGAYQLHEYQNDAMRGELYGMDAQCVQLLGESHPENDTGEQFRHVGKSSNVCTSYEVHIDPPEGYQQITSIIFSREDVFYDLHVPVEEHYIAEGIIHHNSGKTPLLAAIGLFMLLADGEAAAHVVSMASSFEQANLTFDCAKKYIIESPELSNHKGISRKQYVIEAPRYSKWTTISGKPNGRSGPRPSCIIADEAHEWPAATGIAFDLLCANLFKRLQPLLLVATNAGPDRNCYAWTLHERACGVLLGTVDDPTLLPVIFEAPKELDWRSEEAAKAANPSLGDIVSFEQLKPEQSKGEARYRRLYLSQWISGSDKWLDLTTWDACIHPLNAEAIKGAPRYVGLDLSNGDDLCAMVDCYTTTTTFHIDSHFWIPKVTAEKYEAKDLHPYHEWGEVGAITLLDSPTISIEAQKLIAQYVIDEHYRHPIVAVCFDRAYSTGVIEIIRAAGIRCEPIGQGWGVSQGCAEHDRRLIERSISIAPNAVLRFCASNVEIKTDERGNYWPVKPHARGKYAGRRAAKIDGISSLVTCLTEARKHNFPQPAIHAGASIIEL
jgi:phage terminase large subunit-like protein